MTSPDASADTLADAITTLRKRMGSHAKLAEAVGASERQVKRWQKDAVPGGKHREALIRLGVPAALFLSASTRADLDRRLRAVEGEIASLRSQLQGLP